MTLRKLGQSDEKEHELDNIRQGEAEPWRNCVLAEAAAEDNHSLGDKGKGGNHGDPYY